MHRPTRLAGGLALVLQGCAVVLSMRWMLRRPGDPCDIVLSHGQRFSAGHLQQGLILASLLFGLVGLAVDKKRACAILALLLIVPIIILVVFVALSGCD
jgi:hypothetical protein